MFHAEKSSEINFGPWEAVLKKNQQQDARAKGLKSVQTLSRNQKTAIDRWLNFLVPRSNRVRMCLADTSILIALLKTQ